MAKWKFVGFREQRLYDTNEYNINLSISEICLVDSFNKEQNPGSYLQDIVNHPKGYLTPDEEKIAMTVIQWFGTNVGRAFHEAAMKKADHQIETVMNVQQNLRRHKRETIYNDPT